MTTTQDRKDFLSAQDWADIGLVIVTGLGGDECEWPSLIRENTSAPILVFEPREEVCGRYVNNVRNCLVSKTMTTMRGRMREVAPDVVAFPDVLCFTDDEEGLEEEHAKVEETWAIASESAGYRHFGAMNGSQRRVDGMIGSLDLLIRHKPVNHLHGAFRGVPGVCVGAGPGLDKNLHVLAEMQEHCLIAGVNSSLPALDAAGIVPHFTVICEAKPIAESIAGRSAINGTIMVPGIHVHRDTFSLPWKDVAPAISREAVFGQWITRVMGLQSIPIGGSSACLAAGVLYSLGCDPIILIGNDCAQADDGQLYSDNAAFAGTTITEDGVMEKSDAKMEVEDIGKRKRCDQMPLVEVTSWDKSKRINAPIIYDVLRHWFEEMADFWKERRLINATESGSHIYGWEHITLAEALDGTEELPHLAEAIARLLDFAPLPDEGGMASAVDEQIEGCRKVGSICREGLRNMKKVRGLHADIDLTGLRPWAEIEKQKRRESSKPVMIELAELYREHGQEEAATLLERCREIQEEVYAYGQSIDLLDAWSWGEVEKQRYVDTERPAFEILGDMFAEIERASVELEQRLLLAREGISLDE